MSQPVFSAAFLDATPPRQVGLSKQPSSEPEAEYEIRTAPRPSHIRWASVAKAVVVAVAVGCSSGAVEARPAAAEAETGTFATLAESDIGQRPFARAWTNLRELRAATRLGLEPFIEMEVLLLQLERKFGTTLPGFGPHVASTADGLLGIEWEVGGVDVLAVYCGGDGWELTIDRGGNDFREYTGQSTPETAGSVIRSLRKS